MARRQRLVVVGGGVAGLAAAHRALELRPDAEVVVLEAAARAGGLVATERVDGFLIESGPDSFLIDKPETLALAKRIGLEAQVIRTQSASRGAYVVCRGKLQRVPLGFSLVAPTLWGHFLRTPILSWRGKLRAMGDLVLPRRRVASGVADEDDESLEAFVTRRFGRELFERLAEPLAGGIYGADPRRLSLSATMPRFAKAEAQSRSVALGLRRDAANGARYGLFMSFADGMQTLVDALVQKLGDRLRTGTQVEHIGRRHDAGAWQLALRDGQRLEADGLILAVPAWRAAELLSAADHELSAQLAAIEYGSSAAVTLGWHRREDVHHRLDAFGVVVPAIEGRALLASTWASVKYAGRAPAGGVLLRTFLGGFGRPAVIDADDAALEEIALSELRQLMGPLAAPSLMRVHRYRRSMPRYYLGHARRVAAIETRLRHHPGLQLAGNAYHGVGLADAIRSGEAAAASLLYAGD